jgi:hypothetical protein
MTPTDVHHVQEIRPGSLMFQMLGTAHSVTARLAAALAECAVERALSALR